MDLPGMGPVDTNLEAMMSDRTVWSMVALGLVLAVLIAIGKALFSWLE